MKLAPERVAALQYFLMDSAKRFAAAKNSGADAASGLLSNAAALDYALAIVSERPDEVADDDAPAARSLRETVARAATVSLDFIGAMQTAPEEAYAAFAAAHLGSDGIFSVLSSLVASGVLAGDDLRFRILTQNSDAFERRRA